MELKIRKKTGFVRNAELLWNEVRVVSETDASEFIPSVVTFIESFFNIKNISIEWCRENEI